MYLTLVGVVFTASIAKRRRVHDEGTCNRCELFNKGKSPWNSIRKINYFQQIFFTDIMRHYHLSVNINTILIY